MSARVGWSHAVGVRPHKVVVYEHQGRDGVLYLRWRAGGNWRLRSLRRPLRDEAGRPLRGRELRDVQQWAIAEAMAQYQRNERGEGDAPRASREPAAPPAAPLTIAEGLARATDRARGKYPVDGGQRRRIESAMRSAIAVWGGETPWERIKRADFTALWRQRFAEARERRGRTFRGAEATVERVCAVAQWLRDEELIPPGAAVAPRHWKQLLRADYAQLHGGGEVPTPRRPRHTVEELRRILAVAHEAEPRLALLLALGAELRAGQVLRALRSDLDLDAGDHGTLTVRSRGRKKGVLVELTRGQRAEVDRALGEGGYLRALEAAYQAAPERARVDYALFPSGKLIRGAATVARHLTTKSVNPQAAREWFLDAEAAAGVEHAPGRSFYGLRRVAVDAATDLSATAGTLQHLGGWTDTATPMGVYRDKESGRDRLAARDLRARIRGETDRDETAGGEGGATGPDRTGAEPRTQRVDDDRPALDTPRAAAVEVGHSQGDTAMQPAQRNGSAVSIVGTGDETGSAKPPKLSGVLPADGEPPGPNGGRVFSLARTQHVDSETAATPAGALVTGAEVDLLRALRQSYARELRDQGWDGTAWAKDRLAAVDALIGRLAGAVPPPTRPATEPTTTEPTTMGPSAAEAAAAVEALLSEHRNWPPAAAADEPA